MECKIRLCEANRAKIEEFAAKVEGRARERRLTFSDLAFHFELLEKKFGLVPKKYLEGLKVEINVNAQKFPKSYKFDPQATLVWVTRQGGHWLITDISRAKCTTHTFRILEFPDELKKAIIKSMEVF